MTMKIHNIKGEFKGIKNKTDINQAIDLVKSVKVIKSNVEPIDGVGYGVEITYTDGKKENISFSSTYMIHDGKYYEVDKNVVNDLKSIYDKIQFSVFKISIHVIKGTNNNSLDKGVYVQSDAIPEKVSELAKSKFQFLLEGVYLKPQNYEIDASLIGYLANLLK